MEKIIAIAKVNGVEILVVQSKKLVPIKPLCEIMGIDYKAQLVGLKIDRVLGPNYTRETFTDTEGKTYDMALPIKYVFWWIAQLKFENQTKDESALANPSQLYVYEVLWDFYNSYQEYVEYRNQLIEEQNAIREAARSDFESAKDKVMEADREMKHRLAITFEDYLEKVHLRLDYYKDHGHGEE